MAAQGISARVKNAAAGALAALFGATLFGVALLGVSMTAGPARAADAARPEASPGNEDWGEKDWGAIPEAVNTGRAWEVYKSAWEAGDEAGYAAFVQRIGRSACRTMAECLSSPESNPYAAAVDPYLNGDCADMAYVLRAYYAWKNGLPFSYQNAMAARGRGGDIRYSEDGNVVAGRRQILNSVANAPAFLARIGREVSTAMFRTHPETGGGRGHDDFYAVRIDREAVRPGVIAYDVYGHVGLVYDVLDDGRIAIVASHPDNSVTRTTFGRNFTRADPKLGAGLKGWRPIRVAGASRDADGSLRGGRLKAAANDMIAGFSLEQYIGARPSPNGVWYEGAFEFENRELPFYNYVRMRLAAPGFQFNPVTELRTGLDDICGAVKARKTAVDNAVLAGVHQRAHPKRLPPNIYGTYGAWEEYSTPSRDARLKVAFIDLRRETQALYEAAMAGEPGVRYEGRDLARDLLEAFVEEKDACTFTYWRSDKTRMRLNLGHVMDRLFDLSFNPYLCPERRWGARGQELDTCPDDAEKARWYDALRFLRYQADRTYDVAMDFSLDELKPPMIAPPAEGGLGVDAPADADIAAYLARINGLPDGAGPGAPRLLTSADRSAL